MNKYFKNTALTILCLCACVALFYALPHETLLSVYFIDVGYGDSILIRTPNKKAILIDAGDESHSNKLIEFLKSCRVKRIDVAMITHPHQDHFEGFLKISHMMPIRSVFINGDARSEVGYEALLDKLAKNKIPISLAKADQTIFLDDCIKLKILNPSSLTGSANDNSIVSLLEYKNISFLFTSNISEEAQKQLIKYKGKIANACCVQIPHHGRSINLDFFNIFKQANFIISTGQSPWGPPDEKILSRIPGKIFRTDRQGTIRLTTDGKNFWIKTSLQK